MLAHLLPPNRTILRFFASADEVSGRHRRPTTARHSPPWQTGRPWKGV